MAEERKAKDLKKKHGRKGAIRAVKYMIECCKEDDEGQKVKVYWQEILIILEKK